jgi:hypothetical protein
VYALVILLVIIWTGYAAASYLLRSLFSPTHVPERFLEWRGHLEAEALRAPEVPGITEPAIRASLSHYHGVDRWFQYDPHNTCSSSGCHLPLPHNDRKELRAFANLHATFLDCEMCHDKRVDEGPVSAVWMSTASGERQGPPAILLLMRELELGADSIESDPASIHPRIVDLLGQITVTIGGDPLLDFLLLQIRTSAPGSPVWRRSVSELIAEIPNHARGEYGAKLMLEARAGDRAARERELADLARQYLAAPAGSKRREEVDAKIHEEVIAKPSGCLACHGGEPSRLDYSVLGYSPNRAGALRSASIARLMQHILEGQVFHLPSLLEESHGQ